MAKTYEEFVTHAAKRIRDNELDGGRGMPMDINFRTAGFIYDVDFAIITDDVASQVESNKNTRKRMREQK
jgi:hypothetical protein